MAIEIPEIDFEQVGTWPNSLKITVYIIVFALILAVGYWFDVRTQLINLDKSEKQQVQFRKDIATQQKNVLPIAELNQQIKTVQSYLDNILKDMPGSAEVPNILEDISAQGIKSGLEFRSIRPLPEIKHKLYAEIPFSMVVVGTYHQLGKFAADLAALQRYIVIKNFSLSRLDNKPIRTRSGKRIQPDPQQQQQLTMSLRANIYRSIPLK